MSSLILAFRFLARDLRSGELAILIAALLVAVGSVSSVGFFADRVRLSLERESGQMLGADMLLISDHPWSQEVTLAIEDPKFPGARPLAESPKINDEIYHSKKPNESQNNKTK